MSAWPRHSPNPYDAYVSVKDSPRQMALPDALVGRFIDGAEEGLPEGSFATLRSPTVTFGANVTLPTLPDPLRNPRRTHASEDREPTAQNPTARLSRRQRARSRTTT